MSDEIMSALELGCGRRDFAVDAWHIRADDDGRTVDGRIIPYLKPTTITERDRVTGERVTYREQFMRGACTAMIQTSKRRGNAGWIAFVMDHKPDDFASRIGYAREIREEEDGAYATFRLYPGRDLEKVVGMLAESHTGLSVNFADRVAPELRDGIVTRKQVYIDHVAATPTPAYAGAGILAMREESAIPPAETPKLDELRAWLEEMRRVPA